MYHHLLSPIVERVREARLLPGPRSDSGASVPHYSPQIQDSRAGIRRFRTMAVEPRAHPRPRPGRGCSTTGFEGASHGGRSYDRGVRPAMDDSWLEAVGAELETPAMQDLRGFLAAEMAAGRGFYPPGPLVFNALRLTPLDEVRVVVLGQDPYHGRGQAMGPCFSVPVGIPAPPSLRNIFTEPETDLGLPAPATGDLTVWAERGVLLLNSVLTVAPGSPASHAGR